VLAPRTAADPVLVLSVAVPFPAHSAAVIAAPSALYDGKASDPDDQQYAVLPLSVQRAAAPGTLRRVAMCAVYTHDHFDPT
jgi:hypothetical protein